MSSITSETQAKGMEDSTAQSSVDPSESIKHICKKKNNLTGQHKAVLNLSQVIVTSVDYHGLTQEFMPVQRKNVQQILQAKPFCQDIGGGTRGAPGTRAPPW